MNPFQSALAVVFAKEREFATNVTPDDGVAQNEQLVWVLWKILKGDGGDVSVFIIWLKLYARRCPIDRPVQS